VFQVMTGVPGWHVRGDGSADPSTASIYVAAHVQRCRLRVSIQSNELLMGGRHDMPQRIDFTVT